MSLIGTPILGLRLAVLWGRGGDLPLGQGRERQGRQGDLGKAGAPGRLLRGIAQTLGFRDANQNGLPG